MVENALFYKDNYLMEFESEVIECFEEKGKIKVVLENTAFYPEGGGQPADIGTLNDVNVYYVEEKDGKIYHFVDNKISKGTKVKGKVDFENRFANMQGHSGEHIISGLICKNFNASNVGFHMGKDFITMDFDKVLTIEDLRKIEEMANEAIYKDISIKIKVYSNEEAKNINYRSKKELQGNIRIVEIPGCDICCCCGIHVTKTGEIGIVKILKVEKYKIGSRVYMLAGKKAIENYTQEYDMLDKIGNELSLKHYEVDLGVKALKDEIENYKKEIVDLKRKVFDYKIKDISEDEKIILFENDLDFNDIKMLTEKLLEKASKIAAVFSKNENIYRFVMMSNSIDLKEFAGVLRKEFNAKCGGNMKLIQGQIEDKKEKIIEIIEKI